MNVFVALIIFSIMAIVLFGAWIFTPWWLGWTDREGLGLWYGIGWVIPMGALGILIGVAMHWKG